ncbi:MAG: HU family DNA-binding protein [Oscillospiraceae bacterium]|jgi:DNA-binding protein HU-beta|nr:HU family DNA-binding protein [Oscillospiraceae bacterium]
MTKSTLVSVVAEKTGLTKANSELAVNAVFEGISESLSDGDKVQIIGFGSFEVRERKEKTTKNPRTGEPCLCPASKAPVFKSSKLLKNTINEGN